MKQIAHTHHHRHYQRFGRVYKNQCKSYLSSLRGGHAFFIVFYTDYNLTTIKFTDYGQNERRPTCDASETVVHEKIAPKTWREMEGKGIKFQ